MKQVIFKRGDVWYMTTLKNYTSYIWDARKVHKLEGVTDPYETVEQVCRLYNDDPANYYIISD